MSLVHTIFNNILDNCQYFGHIRHIWLGAIWWRCCAMSWLVLPSHVWRPQRWASFVLNTLLHCMEGSRYKSLSCQVCGRGTQDNTIDSIQCYIYICVPTVAHKHTLCVYLLLSKQVSEGNNCKMISAYSPWCICTCTWMELLQYYKSNQKNFIHRIQHILVFVQ